MMTRLHPHNLEALEERLADDLLLLNYPAKSWTKPLINNHNTVLWWR
ncbi:MULTISPECIES: hypothetical protein [Paenochrobactrum]